MGLLEDMATLQAEKEKILAQMEKLEAKKEAVRPELYEKVKAPLDEKMAAVEKQIAEIEAVVAAEAKRREEEEQRRREEEQQRREAEERRQREAEERRQREAEERQQREAEERRKREEQERRRQAEAARRQTEQREKVLAAFWKKHAAELETLKTGWQRQVDAKIKEYREYLDARLAQRDNLSKKLSDTKQQIDELALRKEIGEFEEDEDTYALFMDPLQEDLEKNQKDLTTATDDLEQVEKEFQQLQGLTMPDFETQLLEKYAAELEGAAAPAPREAREEVYEPEENPDEEVFEPTASEDELAGGRIVHEELLDRDAVADDEDIETEYEEIYEDEAEQAFFADEDNHGFVSATINPCLVETKADGRQAIHELILAGKTLIGSNEDCDIYLPHPGIAPRHCTIKLDRKGHFQLKTVDGKVTVNGHHAKKATLKHGDMLGFGKLEMSVHIG